MLFRLSLKRPGTFSGKTAYGSWCNSSFASINRHRIGIFHVLAPETIKVSIYVHWYWFLAASLKLTCCYPFRFREQGQSVEAAIDLLRRELDVARQEHEASRVSFSSMFDPINCLERKGEARQDEEVACLGCRCFRGFRGFRNLVVVGRCSLRVELPQSWNFENSRTVGGLLIYRCLTNLGLHYRPRRMLTEKHSMLTRNCRDITRNCKDVSLRTVICFYFCRMPSIFCIIALLRVHRLQPHHLLLISVIFHLIFPICLCRLVVLRCL